jgi:membrane fusion protein
MTQSLFRIESLTAKSDRIGGQVKLSQPLRFRFLNVVFVLTVVALLAFLIFGEYARRQASVGAVTAASGSVRVQSRFTGLIDQINVTEGKTVNAGQVLIALNNQRLNDGSEDIDQLLITQLQASLTEIDRKLQHEAQSQALEHERIKEQLNAVVTDIASLQNRLATEQQKLQLIASRKQDFERLQGKGFISDAQNTDQQQLWLEARANVDELQRVLSKQQAQQRDLALQLQQLPAQQQSRLADLKTQRGELNQRLIEAEARRAFAVVAPVSGRITALQVKPGQTITPQTVLMTIVPEHAVFEAELFVPTRAIGFVREGQPVYLRYQAFPYQRYGLYEGRIKTIAKAILTPQEIVTAVPLPNEPVYRVVVSLNQQQVQAYGKQFELQSGMLLEADIVLDRRPIWQWLLEPVLSLRGRV